MSPFQRKLAAYSRDRTFLIRAVATILILAVIAGPFASKLLKSDQAKPSSDADIVENLITYESDRDRQALADILLVRGKPSAEGVAHYITFINTFIHRNLLKQSSLSDEKVLENVSPIGAANIGIESHQTILTDDQRLLFHNYTVALYKKDEKREEARAFLAEQAAAEPPIRFANEFYAEVLSRDREQRSLALSHFQKEAENFPRSDFSRFRSLELNLQLEQRDQLRALLAKPDYRQLASPRYLAKLGIGLRDPALILEGFARLDLQDFKNRVFPLCLFTGLVWFTILTKLGGVRRLISPRLLLYTLCLIAGYLSATFTLLPVVWQDDVMGFRQNGEFLNDLIYCFSGISLREEICKILFFLPFVPFIAKRRTSIEILIGAACVGLGFSINENINYFQSGGPAAAFARLLTASFLHISLTGLLGLAVCRFYHYPKRYWEQLIGTFVGVVLAHGLYDALLIVRELREQIDMLYIIVLAVCVRYFFKQVAATRGTERHIISSLGVFVIGCALVIAVSWIYAMRYYGSDIALDGVGKGAFASGIVAFLYINALREE